VSAVCVSSLCQPFVSAVCVSSLWRLATSHPSPLIASRFGCRWCIDTMWCIDSMWCIDTRWCIDTMWCIVTMWVGGWGKGVPHRVRPSAREPARRAPRCGAEGRRPHP
jgi:hypothetical protein